MELPVDREHLTRTLRRHGVVFALVFGSHARGDAGPDSDLDLAVWAHDGVDLWALTGELAGHVDVLDLRGTSEGMAGRVAMEGVVVLDDDPPARVSWQARTRMRHLDEAPRRARFLRDFVDAHG